MIRNIECLAATGSINTAAFLSLSFLLVTFGLIFFYVAFTGRVKFTIFGVLFLGTLVMGALGQNWTVSANATGCATNAAPAVIADTSPTATPSPSDSTTPTPTPSATPTPTPSQDGLTIFFAPQADPQYVWYCPNKATGSVCSGSPSRTMTNSSFTANQVNGVESINIPLTTFNAENIGTGYFSLSVKAPGSTSNWEKIGPGAGITCLQRTSTLTGAVGGTGTSFNNVSKGDWTGAGTINSVQQYHFWFSGCSLNSGVTYAEFYGILK